MREGGNCWLQLWTPVDGNNTAACAYYYNTLTGETRWHKPMAMDIFGDQFAQPMSAAAVVPATVRTTNGEEHGASVAANGTMDAADWYEGFDDAVQAAYYYNARTKEYQWDRPDSITNSFSTATATSRRRRAWLEQNSQTPDALEQLLTTSEDRGPPLGQWQKRVDPLSGHFFYFHGHLREVRASLSPRSVHASLATASTASDDAKNSDRSHRSTGRRTARSIEAPGSASRPLHWQFRYSYDYDASGNLVPLSAAESARRRIWTEHTDAESGLPYYFNVLTNEYRWDKPADFDVDYEAFASGASASSRARQWFQEKVDAREQATGSGRSASGRSASGDVSSGRSSTGLLTTRSVKSRALGKKWVEYVDADSGHAYYYNEITGETRWSLSPRSARDDADSDDQISLALFEQVRALRALPEGDAERYPGREEHMAWLEEAMEAKDWAKVDVLVQQIVMRQHSHRTTSRLGSDPVAVLNVASATTGPDDASAGSEWVAYTDESSGSVCYYNARTGETSWSRPTEVGATGAGALDSDTLAAAAWGDLDYSIDT